LAAVRILVSRKLDGTVEALLGYLPYCIDEDLEWEIYTALEALGCQQGRVHPAIEKSLVDRMPARRAAAGCLLARLGNQQQHAAARKLLKDSDPLVRLRVAQGLLADEDASSIPALIELLVGPLFIAWQSEELLRFVAGEKSPRLLLRHGSGNAAERCVAEWKEWWQSQQGRIDWKAVEASGRCPRLVLVSGVQQQQELRWWEPNGLLCGFFGRWLGHEQYSSVSLYGSDGGDRANWVAPWDDPWDDPEVSRDGIYQVVSRRNLDQILIYARKPSTENQLTGGRVVPDTVITELGANGAILSRCRRHEPLLPTLGANPKALFEVAELDLPTPPVALREFDPGEQRILFKGWFPNGSWGLVLSDQFDQPRTALIREWNGRKTREGERLEDWDWQHGVPLGNGGWLAKQGMEFLELSCRGKVVWKAAVPPHEVDQAHATGCQGLAPVHDGDTLFSFKEDPHERLMFDVQGQYARSWKYRIVEANVRGHVVMEFPVDQQITGLQSCFTLIRFGFDRFRPSELDLRSLPSLLRRLDSSDARTRELAAATLHCLTNQQELEKVLPQLAEHIPQSDALAAEHIRDLLVQDLPEKGVPALCKALKHPERGTRLRAIEALSLYCREHGKSALVLKAPILACLDDADPRVIAATLGALPPEEYRECVPRLISLLKTHGEQEGDAEVFYALANVLLAGNVAQADIEALLTRALSMDKLPLKRHAARIFAEHWKGELPKDASKLLLTAFMHETDSELRVYALWCLRDVKDPPKEVMADVLRILDRPRLFGASEELKDGAAVYCKFAKSDTSSAIPSLIAVFSNPRESRDLRRRVGACLVDRWPTDERVRTAFKHVCAALETAAQCADQRTANAARRLLDDLTEIAK
jgi:HEAT repeat protein